MTLIEQVNADLKTAMKEKNKEKLNALRAVKSQFLLIKTSGSGKDEISDAEALKVIQKMIKQRIDSAEIYKSQNRDDLFENEMNEVSFLKPYLPAQLSDEEIEKAVTEIIAQTGASSIKDMGKVMGMASKQLAGKADGKTIAAKVKNLLSK